MSMRPPCTQPLFYFLTIITSLLHTFAPLLPPFLTCSLISLSYSLTLFLPHSLSPLLRPFPLPPSLPSSLTPLLRPLPLLPHSYFLTLPPSPPPSNFHLQVCVGEGWACGWDQ